MNRKRNTPVRRRTIADAIRDFAHNLAEQDAGGVPLMPKTHNLVREAIESFVAQLRADGNRGTYNDRDMEVAIGEYGRTLQKRVNRQAESLYR